MVRCGRRPKYRSLRCSAGPALDDGAVRVRASSLRGGAVVGQTFRPAQGSSGEGGSITNHAMEKCFSCGQQGHGVTWCSLMDVSFPFLLPGWSVDIRNGRYRASRIRGDGRNYTPGKVGWSGRESQPPRSSDTVVQLTPRGWGRRVLGDASRLGNSRWGLSANLVGPRMPRVFRPWGEPLSCE